MKKNSPKIGRPHARTGAGRPRSAAISYTQMHALARRGMPTSKIAAKAKVTVPAVFRVLKNGLR